MQVTKKLKLGSSEYEITGTGKDFHEAVMDLGKVSIYNLEKCGLCSSDLLRLSAYITQDGGYKYIKVTCAKCKASLTLGEAKGTHANYYRKNKDTGKLDWKAFEGKEGKINEGKGWDD